jgi:hypothetical protein
VTNATWSDDEDMKKALGFPLLLVGLLCAVTGIYAINRAFDGRDTVRDALRAQNVTTPAQASIPNERVDDAATAQSMSDFISDALEGPTGGRNYNEIGRYLTADGKDTNDVAAAAIAADGMPMENPLREVAFEASTGQTSLGLSVAAFNMVDMAIGLGALFLVMSVVMVGGGIALVGVPVPTFARRRSTHDVAVQQISLSSI